MTDKLTPRQLTDLAKLHCDWMREYQDISFSAYVEVQAARREAEQKPCRWCAKLAGCTGACGKDKPAPADGAKPWLTTQEDIT